MVCIILFYEVFDNRIVHWEDKSRPDFSFSEKINGYLLIACKWYSSYVWIGLICDYTLLSSKERNAVSYEEWRALWMDISIAYSGLSVVLRSSFLLLYAYCLGDIYAVL
jgi:hypothetical protein